jgi:SpoIID/LytB domain protein
VRLPRPLHGLLAALVLTAGLLVVPPPAAGAYPVSNLKIAGHGWGHGRGMGQWGALGYALNHGWTWEQILTHYYGGTAMGTIVNDPLGIQIKRMDGYDTIVQQEKGDLVINGEQQLITDKAALARRVGGNRFDIYVGPGCGGGWTKKATVDGPVVFGSKSETPANDDHTTMLQLCDPSAVVRWYRGDLEAHDHGGQVTLNRVEIESYLRGVVPRESPASWGDQGGGKGMHALRAQAVAARSYARAENRDGPAETCDTISCQVYLGRAEQTTADPASFKHLEHPNTDLAIAETAGKIRQHSTGHVARTEFSSSTGGWSAGGTFPAVADEGDSISTNPNHAWETTLAVSTVEAAYGKGSLQGVEIRSRNGLGAMGVRVLSMRLAFSQGTVDVTGDDFRRQFSLKSNWFDVSDAVGIASFPYHVVGADGGVFGFGGATYAGSLPEYGIRTTVTGMAEGPGGYWLLGHDGGVFSFGVPFHGSMGGQQLNQPVVGMAATVPGGGYWLVASDGGVFSFGDATFYGSTGAIALNQPMVGMGPTPSGAGYWLVARDGGVFSYGDATFYGSTGAMTLNQPVVAMAAHPSGNGYWLLAADGGLFAFGVDFYGSLPGAGVLERAVGMAVSESGNGYLILTAEGNVYGFGDAASGGGPANFGATIPSAAIGAER